MIPDGWIGVPDDIMERRLSRFQSLYIERTNDGWVAYRIKWMGGSSRPIDEKEISRSDSFDHVLQRANNYVEWWFTKGPGRGNGNS